MHQSFLVYVLLYIFILSYTFIPTNDDIPPNTIYSDNLNQEIQNSPVIKKYNSNVDLASETAEDSVKKNDNNYKKGKNSKIKFVNY